MDRVVEFLTQFPDLTSKILLSLLILLILSVVKRVISITISRRVKDSSRVYHWHRAAVYIHVFLVVILVGSLWISGIESIATFLGLAGAGIAVAMHDTIANIAGWAFILWRKPFVVGDRVQIGDTCPACPERGTSRRERGTSRRVRFVQSRPWQAECRRALSRLARPYELGPRCRLFSRRRASGFRF